MQRVTAALKAPSVLFCKVQRPIQVYATSLYVFIGLDLYLISASKEDAKHRTKLFKRSTTLRWTDAEGTDREQNLVQTRADQDTGGGSMIAPLTPNLVLLVFFLLKGSSSFPLSQSACSSSDCWVFSATSHHRRSATVQCNSTHVSRSGAELISCTSFRTSSCWVTRCRLSFSFKHQTSACPLTELPESLALCSQKASPRSWEEDPQGRAEQVEQHGGGGLQSSLQLHSLNETLIMLRHSDCGPRL